MTPLRHLVQRKRMSVFRVITEVASGKRQTTLVTRCDITLHTLTVPEIGRFKTL